METKYKSKTQTKITKKIYVDCPKCGKEIFGTSANQVDYNLKNHLDKHLREEMKKLKIKLIRNG